MSKVVVTDLEHIPEGPPRDLMMYLDDNGEVIQRLDASIFWTIIISYICAYYDADAEGPLSKAITELAMMLMRSIEHCKKVLREEVNDE